MGVNLGVRHLKVKNTGYADMDSDLDTGTGGSESGVYMKDLFLFLFLGRGYINKYIRKIKMKDGLQCIILGQPF